MSADQPSTTVRFEIKSLDPDRPIIQAVPEAENLASDLQAILAAEYPGVTVEIRRVEGIPGARELQELLLHVDWHAVGVAVETTAAGWATKEFLNLVKVKLRNVFAKPAAESGAAAVKPSAPAAARKKSSASRRKGKPAKPSKSRGKQKKKSQSSQKKRRR